MHRVLLGNRMRQDRQTCQAGMALRQVWTQMSQASGGRGPDCPAPREGRLPARSAGPAASACGISYFLFPFGLPRSRCTEGPVFITGACALRCPARDRGKERRCLSPKKLSHPRPSHQTRKKVGPALGWPGEVTHGWMRGLPEQGPCNEEIEPSVREGSRAGTSPSWRLQGPLHRSVSTLLRIGIMKLLKKETFCVQFNNRHRAPRPYRRRRTYLCYQLQLPGSTTRDYFQNKKGRHAEIRFIEMIRSLELDRDQNCQVTCYLTWSPCPGCAQELVELKRSHPRLMLQLFTSRLYFHWIREFQEGLQLLWRSGIPIKVMGLREFTYCWDEFVDHRETPFELERWEGLERHSQTIQNRLYRILTSWGLEHLIDDLRNLRL